MNHFAQRVNPGKSKNSIDSIVVIVQDSQLVTICSDGVVGHSSGRNTGSQTIEALPHIEVILYPLAAFGPEERAEPATEAFVANAVLALYAAALIWGARHR